MRALMLDAPSGIANSQQAKATPITYKSILGSTPPFDCLVLVEEGKERRYRKRKPYLYVIAKLANGGLANNGK